MVLINLISETCFSINTFCWDIYSYSCYFYGTVNDICSICVLKSTRLVGYKNTTQNINAPYTYVDFCVLYAWYLKCTMNQGNNYAGKIFLLMKPVTIRVQHTNLCVISK